MIDIVHKEKCCGCQACVEKCPRKCISLEVDNEGFWYPLVNADGCINCHLCEKVCPIINKKDERLPIGVYAAKNNNDVIRENSSSGGIFSLLAEKVIKHDGVVFGAKWNSNWEVEHGYCDTIEGLSVFRGSKYVQSNINGCYSRVESFLKEGRDVLFSGTPCQIAGLKGFLGKEYDNLLLVDCICHGVPSPGIFRQYIKELEDLSNKRAIDNRSKNPENGTLLDPYKLKSIKFRDKKNGWSNYYCTFTFASINDSIVYSTPNMENPYFRGFNSDLFSRPSCNVCAIRGLRSGSDITLGDFWGISEVMPEIDDDRGVSAVIINTLKGDNYLKSLDLQVEKTSYDVICKYNHSVVRSDPPHPHRADFFLHNDLSVERRVNKYCMPTMTRVVLSKMKRVVINLLHMGRNK